MPFSGRELDPKLHECSFSIKDVEVISERLPSLNGVLDGTNNCKHTKKIPSRKIFVFRSRHLASNSRASQTFAKTDKPFCAVYPMAINTTIK